MRVTVDLDAAAAARIERAAKGQQVTPSDFLARAGDDLARRALLDEAIARYLGDPDNVSFSELAEEYGLWVEEIMQEVWRRRADAADVAGRLPGAPVPMTHGDALLADEMFLSGARTIAELRANPALAHRAADVVMAERASRDLASSSDTERT